MGRGARIALSIVVALAALLAINMVFVDAQTKDAEITVAGGEILRLPTGDVQVLDEPAQSRGSATGPAIVLLHCYGCSLHWWDRLAPLLSEHHRVVRVDLLGFGGSEKPKGGYRIADQAATVAAALDQLGVGRAVLVGHSMGFSIAIALATQRRELVSRLVNIDEASAEDDVEMPFLAQLAHVPLVGEAIWQLGPDFAVEDSYRDAFAPGYDFKDGFDNPSQVLDDYHAMTFSSYDEAASAKERYREEVSLADRLRPLAIPLLSIFGAEDQISDVDSSQRAYSSVSGARIVEIDGAGHSPNVEKPAATAALIAEFATRADERLPADPGDHAEARD